MQSKTVSSISKNEDAVLLTGYDTFVMKPYAVWAVLSMIAIYYGM